MNVLLKQEMSFIKLLLTTSKQQKEALVKTITKPQLQAIVQIVYNVLHGVRMLSEKDKKYVQRFRHIIRRFTAKRVSKRQRIRYLLTHLNYFLTLVKTVEKELL